MNSIHQDEGSVDTMTKGDRHESAKLNGRAIGLCAIGLAVLVLFSLLAAETMSRSLGAKSTIAMRSSSAASNAIPESPTLNPHQRESRLKYEAAQRKLLSTYGWIDKRRSQARIPIESAMKGVVRRYERAP